MIPETKSLYLKPGPKHGPRPFGTRLQIAIVAILGVYFGLGLYPVRAASTQPRYYAHQAVHDQYGVIAPWYRGLNGQCDFRIRIAAETLKRYPWTSTSNAVAAYPHYVFSGIWQICSNGVITPKTPNDWANGDLGQRATSVLNGFVDYYRYTGDPAAIAHLTYMANYLLDHSVTPPEHPWPGVFISVPVKGRPYGKCDPGGMIQHDLVGSTGQALLRAYQVVGNKRWLEASKHWGHLLAQHCNLDSQADPWPRYANPESAPWKDNKQTGGVTMILGLLDELIRLSYNGKDDRIVAAREVGQRYLREKLLPAWAVNDTWGRYFWDWTNPVQNCITTPDATRYLMNNKEHFPGWRTDVRNILTLFLNRSSVATNSNGDCYSGAWAYPEACQCCGRSLWYAPLCLAPTLAQYGVQAQSDWCRELAYRQMVLATYDAHPTGMTEDSIDGGVIVNGDWFNIAHPLPLRFVLAAIAWLPEELGASRENHIMRSSAVVNSIVYGKGRIDYSTFDAPAETVDVLRLAFAPKIVRADEHALQPRRDLNNNGYVLKRLPNGDAIVSIRHDGAKRITVIGDDPQEVLDDTALAYEGQWRTETSPAATHTSIIGHDLMDFGTSLHFAEQAGAAVTAEFAGNQVRLIGRTDRFGGLADVYLDGTKQLVHVDCWNPTARSQQVLYYINGLSPGPHVLRVVARGQQNPFSQGSRVYIDALQFSAANGGSGFASGTGPTNTQRMIFGYTGREDYRDSQGHTWRPATELVTRIGLGKDSIAECWWTDRVSKPIANTPDPELYRYGVHGQDFWVNLTVGPGKYYVRLKFAATRGLNPCKPLFNLQINGRPVATNLDVATTAGGLNRALDLVFNDITPSHGIIEIRFDGARLVDGERVARSEAYVQALEVGPSQ
jgi:hypothetical protein